MTNYVTSLSSGFLTAIQDDNVYLPSRDFKGKCLVQEKCSINNCYQARQSTGAYFYKSILADTVCYSSSNVYMSFPPKLDGEFLKGHLLWS